MADQFIISLLNGDVIGFIISCYTSSIGQGFYAIVLAMFFAPLYNKTRSIGLCAILWLLLGSTWFITADVVSPIAIFLVAAGLTGIIFSVFGRR